MVQRIIALALFLVWLTGIALGRGGFIHILLLCALAIAITDFVKIRRTKQT